MFRLKTGASFGIAISLVLLTVGLCAFGQDSTSTHRSVDPGSEQLQNVQIHAQGIAAFFGKLSLVYDIPVGLETAVNEAALSPYSIDFKKGTLADLLTEFVSQHSRYAWKIEDGVVNVFPKEGYRDVVSNELLAIKIQRFSIKKRMSCRNVVDDLVAQPEVKRVLATNNSTFDGPAPSGFYIQNVGRSFSLEVSDVSLRSILNELVRKSPIARFWVITRSRDKTFRLDVSARNEDSPRIRGKRPLEQLVGDERP